MNRPARAPGTPSSPGERRHDLIVERQDGKAGVGGAPVLLRGTLPRRLEEALAPVRWEWSRIEDRRALRHQVARAVSQELLALEPQESRAEVERRLGQAVARLAAEEAVRRKRAAVERARREEVWARHREELMATQAEVAARRCAECGAPEAGGLCLICSETRSTCQALESAARFAAVAAGRADVPGAVAGRLGSCRARLEAESRQAGERWRTEGLPEAAVVWQLRELAEQLVASERELALEVLLDSPQARAEAERVAGIERARRRGSLRSWRRPTRRRAGARRHCWCSYSTRSAPRSRPRPSRGREAGGSGWCSTRPGRWTASRCRVWSGRPRPRPGRR